MSDFTRPSDKSTAASLAALAHPARLAIMRHLASSEACCCKEVVRHLDLAQSTVSQHLKVLVEAGLVSYEPNRPRSRYILNRSALKIALSSVAGIVNDCCEPAGCHAGNRSSSTQ